MPNDPIFVESDLVPQRFFLWKAQLKQTLCLTSFLKTTPKLKPTPVLSHKPLPQKISPANCSYHENVHQYVHQHIILCLI